MTSSGPSPVPRTLLSVLLSLLSLLLVSSATPAAETRAAADPFPLVRRLNLSLQSGGIAVSSTALYWLPDELIRVPDRGLINAVDLGSGQALPAINVSAAVAGRLKAALRLEWVRVDARDVLHVADSANRAILQVHPNGTLLSLSIVSGVDVSFLSSFDVSPDGSRYFFVPLFFPVLTMYDSRAASAPQPLSSLALRGGGSGLAFYGSSGFYLTNSSQEFGAPRSIGLLRCDYALSRLSCVTAVASLPASVGPLPLYIVGGVVALSSSVLAMAVVLNDVYPQTQSLCAFYMQPTGESAADVLQCQAGTAGEAWALAVDRQGRVAALDAGTRRSVGVFTIPPPPTAAWARKSPTEDGDERAVDEEYSAGGSSAALLCSAVGASALLLVLAAACGLALSRHSRRGSASVAAKTKLSSAFLSPSCHVALP